MVSIVIMALVAAVCHYDHVPVPDQVPTIHTVSGATTRHPELMKPRGKQRPAAEIYAPEWPTATPQVK
jgi:hypothetical protein